MQMIAATILFIAAAFFVSVMLLWIVELFNGQDLETYCYLGAVHACGLR